MNRLTVPLTLAFLFAIGAMLGWIIEFLFRNLISHKGPKGRFFINPGFCKGPWLPIYGFGLSAMCAITVFVTTRMDPTFVNSFWGKVIVILFLGLTMITIEFVGGLMLLKGCNMRLWDYRERPGNFMGIVCPLFSLIWTAVGAAYYLFIHKAIIDDIYWFSKNLAFSFFVGLFFGVFIIDYITSSQEAKIIKRFANEHDVVVRYEELKALIQQKLMEDKEKQHFFNQVSIRGTKIEEQLEKNTELLENKAEAFKSRAKEAKALRRARKAEKRAAKLARKAAAAQETKK